MGTAYISFGVLRNSKLLITLKYLLSWQFLAARPRKNDFNARKVSEIVDVPICVKMENLKIGRRSDGYVLIEECDHENNAP